MRSQYLVLFLFFSFSISAQQKEFSIQFEDESLESILELVTVSTDYLFSYNSEIANDRRRFTMKVEDTNLDDFLNRLLTGTFLEHQVFGQQVIIRYMSNYAPVKRIPTFSISGQVKDSVTSKAIPSVNIFLSGTNLGGVSDLDGFYHIDGVPIGSYKVIFSHLSYDLITKEVMHESMGVRTIDAELPIKTVLLDTLQIVSKRLIGSEDRPKYLKWFESEFLGRSLNAFRCDILNPDILDFIYDQKLDKMEVFASGPLTVSNRYLGYEIMYVFEKFERTGNIVDFSGKARFSPLKPKNKREQRVWIRNRRESYFGSFLHFRRALLTDDLRKEGFRINIILTNDLGEVSGVQSKRIERSDMLIPTKEGYEMFFDGFLSITYRKSPDEAYVEQFFDPRVSSKQLSLLKLDKGSMSIKHNGRVEFKGLQTYGYWYWERIGDLLPENYYPDNRKYTK